MNLAAPRARRGGCARRPSSLAAEASSGGERLPWLSRSARDRALLVIGALQLPARKRSALSAHVRQTPYLDRGERPLVVSDFIPPAGGVAYAGAGRPCWWDVSAVAP